MASKPQVLVLVYSTWLELPLVEQALSLIGRLVGVTQDSRATIAQADSVLRVVF